MGMAMITTTTRTSRETMAMDTRFSSPRAYRGRQAYSSRRPLYYPTRATRTSILTLELFVGRAQLGVLLEDILAGQVAGIVGRERFCPLGEGHFNVGCDPCVADKVAVRGKPLGDAEQDR